MAYAVKYTIAFQSMRGVDYTVNILVDGYIGTPQRLRPAQNPFTVDEDNSNNYFETLRSKSGYLRIINEETDLDGNPFSYKDLIATNAQSHQVQLLSGNTLIWIGYIKPVVLTSTLFGYCTTVEIPIQCPISVLKATKLSFGTDTGTVLTMGQIIHSMFSKLNNITWNKVYLTANIRHRDQLGNAWPFPDLNSRISMFNFTDNEDPTMGAGSTFYNYSATWEDETPCADVLEKICEYWGWSLYTRGANIYLIAPGEVHNYYQITFADLANQLSAANVTTADTPTDIEDLSYQSTKHSEEYLQGYRNIKVIANANSKDLVFDPRLDDLTYQGFQVYTYNPRTEGQSRYKSVQAWLENPEQQHKLFLHNCRIFESPCDFLNDHTFEKWNVLCFEDNWKVAATDDPQDRKRDEVKNRFNLAQDTCIYARPGQAPATPTTRSELEAQTYLGMTTLNEVVIPGPSQLCLYGSVRIGLNPNQPRKVRYTDYVRMYLRIGDMWWNGYAWTQTMSIFKVYFTENLDFLTTKAIYDQTTLENNALYPDAKGYIVQNDSTMRGILEVGFLNYPRYDTELSEDDQQQFDILNFSIKCFNQDNIVKPKNKAEQTYEGIASDMFQNDKVVELSIAGGTRNLFGKGQLFASRNSEERFGGCYYEGVVQTNPIMPERYLCTSMQRVFGKCRHRMKIEVAENSIHANPLTRFTYNGVNYIMQCAKHEFVDDKMVLTLIEE